MGAYKLYGFIDSEGQEIVKVAFDNIQPLDAIYKNKDITISNTSNTVVNITNDDDE